MRKFLFFLAIIPIIVTGQDSGDFEIGIGGGINFATFYGEDANPFSSRTGFQAGLTGEYYFSDRWGFKTGLLYDSKGADGQGNKIELNYLFVPLYANWHFGRNRNWYLNFGPHVDVLLSAKDDIDGDDLKDFTSSFDFGLGVGIGHKFFINNDTAFYIEYQGASGFIKVPDIDNGARLQNTRGAFNIGIVF